MKVRVKSLAKSLHQPFEFARLYEIEYQGAKTVVEADGYYYKITNNKAYMGSLLLSEFEEVDESKQIEALSVLVKISQDDIKNGKSMSVEEALAKLKENRKIMRKYYFTFGSNHYTKDGISLGRVYVVIEGTDLYSAREYMHKARGEIWSFSYSEEEFAGQPEKYGLRELTLKEVALNY